MLGAQVGGLAGRSIVPDRAAGGLRLATFTRSLPYAKSDRLASPFPRPIIRAGGSVMQFPSERRHDSALRQIVDNCHPFLTAHGFELTHRGQALSATFIGF